VSSADRPGPRSAIARDFASPGAAWRGKSFWSWNGELETEELRPSLEYEVRVFVQDPRDEMRLGMPATVAFELSPPARNKP